jgi:hypothetical protein
VRCYLCTQLLQFLIHEACVDDHDTLQLSAQRATFRTPCISRLWFIFVVRFPVLSESWYKLYCDPSTSLPHVLVDNRNIFSKKQSRVMRAYLLGFVSTFESFAFVGEVFPR